MSVQSNGRVLTVGAERSFILGYAPMPSSLEKRTR